MTTFNLDEYWNVETGEHLDVARKTFKTLEPEFAKVLAACEKAIKAHKKILFFGNGGSAADAQHLATELAVRYIRDRAAIAALALTTDTSALTAIGNDLGFSEIFARQIEAIGNPGDVAIAISTSGKSLNVLRALKVARKKKLVTIGFTGNDGGEMKSICEINLIVPSKTTARIQEMHITLGQMLCGALEKKLGLI